MEFEPLLWLARLSQDPSWLPSLPTCLQPLAPSPLIVDGSTSSRNSTSRNETANSWRPQQNGRWAVWKGLAKGVSSQGIPPHFLSYQLGLVSITHGELKQQMFMSHGSGGRGPRSGCQCGQALARALFLACRHPPLSVSLLAGHQSHHEGLDVSTSSNFHYLPKASSPKPIMLGVRMTTYAVRGGHQLSIHTVLPSDTWNSTPGRSTL